eukprot:TRINITY_DN55272_c0_g1_i1.p1 TRINITY_DN55272_c0_g1~~TRINITY_DN55272_c0_g1_i1.p1  ORF type:complete len:978 (+),score=125.45 TRINITY_DN55272_c0_g1_i1:136-2934(+)
MDHLDDQPSEDVLHRRLGAFSTATPGSPIIPILPTFVPQVQPTVPMPPRIARGGGAFRGHDGATGSVGTGGASGGCAGSSGGIGRPTTISGSTGINGFAERTSAAIDAATASGSVPASAGDQGRATEGPRAAWQRPWETMRDRSTFAMSFATAFATDTCVDMSRTFMHAIIHGHAENQPPHSAEATIRLDDIYHFHKLAREAHSAAAQTVAIVGPAGQRRLKRSLGVCCIVGLLALIVVQIAFISPYTQLAAAAALSRMVCEASVTIRPVVPESAIADAFTTCDGDNGNSCQTSQEPSKVALVGAADDLDTSSGGSANGDRSRNGPLEGDGGRCALFFWHEEDADSNTAEPPVIVRLRVVDTFWAQRGFQEHLVWLRQMSEERDPLLLSRNISRKIGANSVKEVVANDSGSDDTTSGIFADGGAGGIANGGGTGVDASSKDKSEYEANGRVTKPFSHSVATGVTVGEGTVHISASSFEGLHSNTTDASDGNSMSSTIHGVAPDDGIGGIAVNDERNETKDGSDVSPMKSLATVALPWLAYVAVNVFDAVFPTHEYEIAIGRDAASWLAVRSPSLRAALGVHVVSMQVSAEDPEIFGPWWLQQLLRCLRLHDLYVLHALPAHFARSRPDNATGSVKIHALPIGSSRSIDLSGITESAVEAASRPAVVSILRRLLLRCLWLVVFLPTILLGSALFSSFLRRLGVLTARLQIYSSYTARQMRRYAFIAAPLRRVVRYSTNELLELWTTCGVIFSIVLGLLSESYSRCSFWICVFVCYAVAEYWGIIHVRTKQSRWIFPRAVAALHGGAVFYAINWPLGPLRLVMWTLTSGQLYLMWVLLCEFDCFATLPEQPPHRLLYRSILLPAVRLSREPLPPSSASRSHTPSTLLMADACSTTAGPSPSASAYTSGSVSSAAFTEDPLSRNPAGVAGLRLPT